MFKKLITKTKDIEVKEMCVNCFYYEGSTISSTEKPKQKIILFTECERCVATSLASLETRYG